MEMIKEGKEWRVVLSRKTVMGKASVSSKSRKKDGVITTFFKKLF
jgi:hypothetical protein